MSKAKWFTMLFSAAIAVAVMTRMIKSDTPLEEITEEALQAQTGVDLDLSPGDSYR